MGTVPQWKHRTDVVPRKVRPNVDLKDAGRANNLQKVLTLKKINEP